MSDETPTLTDRQREYLDALPADSLREWGNALGVSSTGAESAKERLNEHPGIDIRYDAEAGWRQTGSFDVITDAVDEETDERNTWEDIEVAADSPSAEELTQRERYLLDNIKTGTTLETLADDIDTRESTLKYHLKDLRARGWDVYRDETTGLVTLAGDHALRSSEHKGTRTRKANQWWEKRHTALVRDFQRLTTPTATHHATPGHEDWVLHLTDIHAGDRVRIDDGTDVYSIDTIPHLIDYVTDRSLQLAEYHGADYDTAHLLWGGDFITNSGIYEGQFEDLDAWLDEQHDTLVEPLLRQLKAHAERFDTVNVVAQIGNHGDHRASGTSKHANADLVLYKSLRNTVAAIREYAETDVLANVNFRIGEAKSYVNFSLRNGRVRGHLRHGQYRKPQATTSARSNEWRGTLINHDFDIAWMGHHHVSGRIPWDGPPIIVSGSPKPPSEFVEKIAASVNFEPSRRPREIAHCHGVADHGVTSVLPIKTHKFDYIEAAD